MNQLIGTVFKSINSSAEAMQYNVRPTDREGNESRVVLYRVVLVQPTIRLEGERIFPDHWIHVTLVEVGKDQSTFGQIVTSERDRLADHVRQSDRG